MERQKRIAARGNSTSGQSLLPSLATRKSLPTKLSPISHKGSKFSDTEPGSSSPLQRSKIRIPSVASADSKKASKVTKSADGSHLTGNRLTRSVSSLSETKKEPNGVTPNSKVSIARIRRLSEPKTVSSHPISSVKARSAELVSKLKPSDGSERKKISAIINLDQSKAATLPELKIKKSVGSLNANQKKSGAKEMKLKGDSVKSVSYELNTTNDRISHHNLDDNSVIERNVVVVLESQKLSFPGLQASEEKMGVTKEHNNTYNLGDRIVAVPEYATIHATPLPKERVYTEPSAVRSVENPSSDEVI